MATSNGGRESGESWASSDASRRVMQGNRGRDTKPELAIRRLAHASGLRYLVDRRPLPSLNRRADMVLRGPRIAVFVDGCFWHGCPIHHTKANANATFWSQKVTANRQRDADTNEKLLEAGWIPFRVWEHDDPAEAVERLVALVAQRRARDT